MDIDPDVGAEDLTGMMDSEGASSVLLLPLEPGLELLSTGSIVVVPLTGPEGVATVAEAPLLPALIGGVGGGVDVVPEVSLVLI